MPEPWYKLFRNTRHKPRCPRLPSLLCIGVAVIQISLLDPRQLQLPPLLTTCPSSAWGLCYSPSVMASTVAPSGPIQSPTVRKNQPMTWSLASTMSNAVGPSNPQSGAPPPPSEYSSSWEVDSGPFPCYCWWSNWSTASSSAPPVVCRGKSQLRRQSTSGFLDWNQCNPKTQSSARIGTSITPDSWSSDYCSIYSTVNAVFWLLLLWVNSCLLCPGVMTYTGSSTTRSHFGSLRAIQMLVVLQSMTACTHCIFRYASLRNYSEHYGTCPAWMCHTSTDLTCQVLG